MSRKTDTARTGRSGFKRPPPMANLMFSMQLSSLASRPQAGHGWRNSLDCALSARWSFWPKAPPVQSSKPYHRYLSLGSTCRRVDKLTLCQYRIGKSANLLLPLSSTKVRLDVLTNSNLCTDEQVRELSGTLRQYAGNIFVDTHEPGIGVGSPVQRPEASKALDRGRSCQLATGDYVHFSAGQRSPCPLRGRISEGKGGASPTDTASVRPD